jgi:hypothetical protein
MNTVHAPAPFIWAAVRSELPRLSFDVLPSSSGTMLPRFQNSTDCEEAIAFSPIYHDDVRVSLDRYDRASAVRRADWLVALCAQDFPLPHWHESTVPSKASVWRCLKGFDYSSVRVVVQVEDVANVPGTFGSGM